MRRVRLVHPKPEEAAESIELLRSAGYQVEFDEWKSGVHAAIRKNPPDAFVIALDRVPSFGKYVAMAMRQSKATRRVPIVFAGGELEKVAPIKAILPDAVYTTWPRVRTALRNAISNPPADPVVPKSIMDYSGTPLAKKLGIKAGVRAVLLGPPEEFEDALGDMPDGAELTRGFAAGADLCIWFVRSRLDLERNVALIPMKFPNAPVWICWPKRTSGMTTDITQKEVREMALAEGLVDYKVCAIDATWSGLLFSVKKAKTAKRR